MELIKTTNLQEFLSTFSGLRNSERDFAQRSLYLCKPKGYNYFVVYDTHFFLVTKKEYEYLLTGKNK